MKLLSIGLAVMLAVSLGFPAYAEVRFGKNVRVGGHDFSNQTFNSKRRGKIYLYEGKPRNEGCDWRKGKNGERVKVCHLQTKKKRK
ncbi:MULTISPECIES: hypothetical protein [Brucella]|jgi:hypothetical protein|uniref:hypothetical protein n=1 Tax=Brucella TaxID=234 RepID=UPI0009A1ED93|nr:MULTISPECIES: hypothetical protein [Brucella]KAB2692297.1 hypothetical protein F9K82_10415 [Brucella pseudogrignonensis]MCD4512766.1 hypothetical protein [Brucella pseudogrignonensis]